MIPLGKLQFVWPSFNAMATKNQLQTLQTKNNYHDGKSILKQNEVVTKLLLIQ